MTFPRKNVLGWALFEELTSGQMNGIDLDQTHALDAEQGGVYPMISGVRGDGRIELDFTAVPAAGAASFLMTAGANLVPFRINDSASLPSGASAVGFVVAMDFTGLDRDRRGADFFASGAASGVRGFGGTTIQAATAAGIGFEAFGGAHPGGSSSLDAGGDGFRALGGTTQSSDTSALAGRGVLGIGAIGFTAGRDGGHGVEGIGGAAGAGATGGFGGRFTAIDGGTAVVGSSTGGTGGDFTASGTGTAVVALAAGTGRGGFFTGGTNAEGLRATATGTEPGLHGINLIGTAGTSAAVLAESGVGPCIRTLQSEDPDCGAFDLDETNEPTNLLSGNVYFDKNAGLRRLGFFNADDSEYQRCATMEEQSALKYAATFSHDEPGDAGVVQIAGDGGSLIGISSVTIGGAGDVELTITWSTARADANYQIMTMSHRLVSGASIVDRAHWIVITRTTALVRLVLFDINLNAPKDLNTDWKMDFMSWGKV